MVGEKVEDEEENSFSKTLMEPKSQMAGGGKSADRSRRTPEVVRGIRRGNLQAGQGNPPEPRVGGSGPLRRGVNHQTRLTRQRN